jgi:hypothetical protein
MAVNTIKGRATAGTGDPEDLTPAQVRTMLNVADGATANTGTVTSVGLSLPGIFSVTNSPVTTSGTLTGSLATQTANTVFAGPTTGSAAAPTFRVLVDADIPNLDAGKITTGTLPVSRGGTGQTSNLSQGGVIYGSSTTAMASSSAGTSGQYLMSNGTSAPSFADLGVLLNIRVLTNGTTYTPTSGTKRARVILIGGGGGGGGGATSTPTTNVFGACGGSGAYVEAFINNVSGTYSYAIGGSGTAGTATGDGGAGGNTTFTNGATVYTANGGSGGLLVNQSSNTSRIGGAGGTASNGLINVNGQRGSNGGFCTASNNLVAFYPGQGGSTPFGWGGTCGAPGSNAGALGNAGTGYGAGGGGGSAHCQSSTARSAAGGAGSPGVIIIYEYK